MHVVWQVCFNWSYPRCFCKLNGDWLKSELVDLGLWFTLITWWNELSLPRNHLCANFSSTYVIRYHGVRTCCEILWCFTMTIKPSTTHALLLLMLPPCIKPCHQVISNIKFSESLLVSHTNIIMCDSFNFEKLHQGY